MGVDAEGSFVPDRTILRDGVFSIDEDGMVVVSWVDPPLAPMDPNADPVPQRIIVLALGTATITDAPIPDDDQVG